MCSSGFPDKPTWATASAYKPFSPSLRTNAGEMCSSSNNRVNGGYRALFRFAIAFSVALVQHRIERPAGRIVGSSRRGRERPTIRPAGRSRSEEHTSELQSRGHLVCRLPLEKKKADISIDVDPVV